MTMGLDGRVGVVTGAGQGLGRCHALVLAARGPKGMVNDLGSGGAPTAMTTLTDGLLPPDAAVVLTPDSVSAAELFLASEAAPSRVIPGAYLGKTARTPETSAVRFAEISDPRTAVPLDNALQQTFKFANTALTAKAK